MARWRRARAWDHSSDPSPSSHVEANHETEQHRASIVSEEKHSLSSLLFYSILFCIVDLFLNPITAQAQTIQWIRQFGTTSSDAVNAVAVDATGIYVVGSTGGTLPGQTRAGLTDAFVRKYDASGNEQWTRQFGPFLIAAARGVAVDATGIYVVGTVYGPLPGQTSAGSTDVFVRKYDVNGNEVWPRQFGTSSNGDVALGVAADATAIYVVGSTELALPGQTTGGLFVRKYDASGNELWTRTFGGGSDVLGGVAVDATGVYVLRNIGCGSTICGAGFVRKYDVNGNELWTSAPGSYASGVAVDTTAVYIVGYTAETLPGQINFTGYVHKYDVGGNKLWSQQLGSSQFTGVAADSTGVYAVGLTSSALPGQPNGGGFVRRYDANGNAGWSRQFGSAGTEAVGGVAVNATGLYISGFTDGTLSGVIDGTVPGQSGGGRDAFVVKLAATALPPPQVPQGSVVNNASFALHPAPIAPGTIIAVFGTNLTKDNVIVDDTALGPDGKIVTTLGGASVKINGIAAPMLRAYPTQLVVQMPVELTGVASAQVEVSVEGQSQSSTPQTFFVDALSPGIFIVGAGQGAILNAVELDQGIKSLAAAVGSFPNARPARPGETVVIFCTGLGRVNDPVPTGVLPSGLHTTVEPTTVIIDGLPVVPDYAGLAPGNAGLYQVNVRVPNGMRLGNNIAVALKIGVATSNTVTIAVQESLEARLVAPSTVTVNLMPPLPPTVPVSVPVTVSLTNRGTTPQTLTAATPCDVHAWTLTDLTDNVIQTEPPEICIQIIASRTIAPGETITENSTVVLDGRLLRDRTSYKLKYRFWGIPSEATLVVQVVQ